MADKTGELNAYAEGGPSGVAAYRQAQSGVSAQRAQALQDAGNRSGAAYAPAEFRAQQATRIGAPLDAAIQGLGAMGSAAGQYQGAQGAAQAGFISNLNGTHGLIQDQLRQQSAQDDIQALNDVNTFLDRQQAQQDKLLAAQDKQKKALDSQNQDFADSAKKFALQDATVDATVDPDTLDVIKGLLSEYSSPEEASAMLERYRNPDDGVVYDGEGKPINDATVQKYIARAFTNPDAQNATPFNAGDHVRGQASGNVIDPAYVADFKATYGRR